MKANMQTLLDLMRIEKPKELRESKFWPHIEAADEQTRYFFENPQGVQVLLFPGRTNREYSRRSPMGQSPSP